MGSAGEGGTGAGGAGEGGAGAGGAAMGGAGTGGAGEWGTGAGGAPVGGDLGHLHGTAGGPPPAVAAAAVAPMSEFMRILVATGEAKSREEHQALREDLCAHVFSQRGEFLEPYVD